MGVCGGGVQLRWGGAVGLRVCGGSKVRGGGGDGWHVRWGWGVGGWGVRLGWGWEVGVCGGSVQCGEGGGGINARSFSCPAHARHEKRLFRVPHTRDTKRRLFCFSHARDTKRRLFRAPHARDTKRRLLRVSARARHKKAPFQYHGSACRGAGLGRARSLPDGGARLRPESLPRSLSRAASFRAPATPGRP